MGRWYPAHGLCRTCRPACLVQSGGLVRLARPGQGDHIGGRAVRGGEDVVHCAAGMMFACAVPRGSPFGLISITGDLPCLGRDAQLIRTTDVLRSAEERAVGREDVEPAGVGGVLAHLHPLANPRPQFGRDIDRVVDADAMLGYDPDPAAACRGGQQGVECAGIP